MEQKIKAKETFAPYVEKLKKPVICLETGAIYDSISAASKESGMSISSISQSCRMAKGRMFKKKSALHFEYLREEAV